MDEQEITASLHINPLTVIPTFVDPDWDEADEALDHTLAHPESLAECGTLIAEAPAHG